MSSLKLDNIQVGRDSDPTKNFHFRTVAANDFRLSSGNIGSPVNDLMRLTNTDVTLLSPKAITTPPQFDNSKLLATTDWVQGNMGQFNGYRGITTNTTLTFNDLEKYIAIGSPNLTITLPSSSGLKIGSTVNIFSAGRVTITAQGTDKIYSVHQGSNLSSIVFSFTTKLVWRGDFWQAFDEFTNFSKSLGSNGYQILPSGLILQWGVGTAGASGASKNNSFPIAFPNACFNAIGNHLGSETSVNILTNGYNQSLVQFSTNYSASDVGVLYHAIGY